MFLNCSCNWMKSRSAAMRTLAIGLLMVSCGLAWQRVFAPLFHLSEAQNDFFSGICIGLGVTVEIVATVALARIRANQPSCDFSNK